MEAKNINITKISLDAENPRINPDYEKKSQTELAETLNELFQSIEIAKSIAEHGFFLHDPLIVLPQGKKGNYVVIEGNRRFSAVMGLTDEKIRKDFSNADSWDALSERAETKGHNLDELPCVVLESREAADVVMGYRHIGTSILSWEPIRQSAWIYQQINDRDATLEGISSQLGRPKAQINMMHRQYQIYLIAKSNDFDVTGLELAFALASPLVTNSDFMTFLNIGKPNVEIEEAFSEINTEHLEELIAWTWGTAEEDPLIPESRQQKVLAKVIGNEEGLEAIRSGLSLQEAQEIVEETDYDPLDLRKQQIKKLIKTLERIDLEGITPDDEIMEMLDDAGERFAEILNTLDET
jgi:hypothetical protein